MSKTLPGIRRGKGHQFKDLSTRRFGRWTVLKKAHQTTTGLWYWLCQCRCGTTRVVNGEHLRLRHSRSCGCLARELVRKRATAHGLSHTRFWRTWREMRTRCTNSKSDRYRHYGARGIRIEWPNFSAFKRDMYVAYLRHVKRHGEKNTTIDRRENDGNYSKENCRWATRQRQNNNTRHVVLITYKGATRTLKEWSRVLHIPYTTLCARRSKLGWTDVRTLETPVGKP